MEYITVEIFTYNDGKADKKATITHENLNSALTRFHQVFGYIQNADTQTIMSVILDKKGYTVRSEYWERKDDVAITE
jgi:hypothetical protein